VDDGVWSSEEEELNFGGTLGIGSAAAAGLIKSATLVEREQRSALPNQEIDYGNNTKSNDADINNFLYSDDGPAGGNYNLPEDINDPSE